jgi:hypothetical protein
MGYPTLLLCPRFPQRYTTEGSSIYELKRVLQSVPSLHSPRGLQGGSARCAVSLRSQLVGTVRYAGEAEAAVLDQCGGLHRRSHLHSIASSFAHL